MAPAVTLHKRTVTVSAAVTCMIPASPASSATGQDAATGLSAAAPAAVWTG